MTEEHDVLRILGISQAFPLTTDAMAHELVITVYPGNESSQLIDAFVRELLTIFRDSGSKVVGWNEIAITNHKGKHIVPDGTTVLAPGICQNGGRLAIEHVASIHGCTVIGIFDEPPPVFENDSAQMKLNACARAAAQHLVQVQLYVEKDSWTLLSLNGAVVHQRMPELANSVRDVLIPKIAARVVPPKAGDVTFQPGIFNPSVPELTHITDDFVSCGRIWANDPSMSAYVPLDEIAYPSPFHRRIVSGYLDQRNGMSYGFFAWQLPLEISRATVGGAIEQEEGIFAITVGACTYRCTVPDVWALTTRSGCKKTDIVPERDIVCIGLQNGKVIFRTPLGYDECSSCKPSFDTVTILAHALGNALAAQLLAVKQPDAVFVTHLREKGLGITHWHGYPDSAVIPDGYFTHGSDNLSVSCSTPQSAYYALTGKIEAVIGSILSKSDFFGDVQYEPHHGCNVSGIMTLTETAERFASL